MGAAMKTIGVIGAGQLGLMLAEEAHKQGARVVTLDPAADAPAARVADGHIVAGLRRRRRSKSCAAAATW